MIKIIDEKCDNCGICKEKCPFSAIDEVDNKIQINSNCKECLVCVKSCPHQAIENKTKAREKKDFSQYKNVCVYGEEDNGELSEVTYELLTKGRELAKKLKTKLNLIIISRIEKEKFDKLKKYGIDEIYMYNYFEPYDCKIYAEILNDFISKYKPNIILFPATYIGRELAPYVASKCDTGITADCTKLEIDENTKLLKQTRPTFGGKMLATITIPNHKPQICTVRPGVFKDITSNKNKKIQLIEETVKTNTKINKIIVSDKKKEKQMNDLKNAEIIVAGGMGLGRKEGFEVLKKLADILGGQIATTRACVDAGWIDKKYQIGQTGINVKPKIYIACGISGAIQHTAGIKNSNYIIAINKDEKAPIFEIADYGIVGDLYVEIPKIIERLGGK